MANFYNKFELQKVLSFLKSAEYIEQQLAAKYIEPDFQRVEYRKFKKRRPLLLKELYLLIIELQDLPSLKEFEAAYTLRYKIKETDYFSEITAVRKAYNSLVRDLHFYFLLKESGKFDNVEIKYRFDLQAQTDILLQKSGKRLGLQLFAGGKNMKERKQQHYRKYKGNNNYELLFFGTEGKGERKRLMTTSGATFTLYSESDVDLVVEALQSSNNIVPSLNDDNFDEFDEFVESIPLTLPTVETNDVAKHSILEIGNVSEAEAKQKKEDYARKGITYYYCKLSNDRNIFIYDGKDFEKEEPLLKDQEFETFNIHQYKIEHELETADIAVMAGAGSGKTYTLVSRTLYLLNMGYIDHVYEVAMITFTNEAANNILEKLSERFMDMYEKTKDNRFMRYLEELREMNIMTIPAFAKFVLNDYGHHIGLGQNVTISALTMKKREFIEKHFNDVYLSNAYNPSILEGIEYYQVRDFVTAFADKLEQKGEFAENIIDKVSPTNPFEVLIVNTLAGVEKSLNDYKQERDVLGLSDLTRYLKRLIDSARSMESLSKKFRYLFIDEFQDTDSLQIEFIVNLSVNANIPILVVGDIKQGIYRFRGANVTAFEIISKRLKESGRGRSVVEHSLVKNYRTAKDVLIKIEDIFSNWRKIGHLTNDEPMKSTRPKSPAKNSYIECDDPISAEVILALYTEMVQRPKEKEDDNRVLSILVRKNREVSAINELLTKQCDDLNIPIQIVKEGTLFKTLAAKDLNALLYSWLNPEDSLALFELSQTAFCKPVELPELKEEDGYFEMDELTFDIPNTWDKALDQLKLAPANIVLNEFLSNTPVKDHLNDKILKQYILNLHKIMTLMNNALNNENTDLYTIYKWISIEIATNNRDDEAELTQADFSKDYIKVMTVHKSKGLEFDTVVLPYVHEKFVLPYVRNSEILVEVDESDINYAWHFKTEKGFENVTENFDKMMGDEQPQLLMEETRNLYVALTRAKECLAIFDMQKPVSPYRVQKPNTWHHLIKGGR
ncbi:UvrD-helicase domain-containing protein [Psychrobacillus sp. BM2]|uniref:UvrD-helicase domain-containing protein n=1 Tax=Psychrobacillus sp. BM2 TaxID=3400421 RepID=UPI003B02C27F